MKKALFASLLVVVMVVLMIETGRAWWFKPPKPIGLWWRVKALEKTVKTLQAQSAGQQRQINRLSGLVETLQTRSVAQQAQINGLSDQVTSIETALALIQMNPVLDLGPYVRVDDINPIDGVNPPNILIHNANVHIRSGSGATDDNGELTGLGNLIVGYNMLRGTGRPSCSNGPFDNEEDCEDAGGTWALNHRTGSHNIVVGEMHNFSQYGGVVFGSENMINGIYASVSGGRNNTASGIYASVSGGRINEASGFYASVSGGRMNEASSFYTSVSGGENNMATEPWATVSGGVFRTAGEPGQHVP